MRWCARGSRTVGHVAQRPGSAGVGLVEAPGERVEGRFGGGGKTRLAIEAAAAAETRYPDGVWFVDLRPVDDADAVFEVAAAALGSAGSVTLTGLPYLDDVNPLRPVPGRDDVVDFALVVLRPTP